MNSSWAFPKPKLWMCRNQGFVPRQHHTDAPRPTWGPSAAPGPGKSFPKVSINPFPALPEEKQPGCSTCFCLGSSNASAVPGMSLGLNWNFTPCLLESAKTLFSWAGQEGGKKTQRGHSGNNYKYRIMGISSHLTPLSQQSQVIPELNISCNSASGLWDSGKRFGFLWFGFLT